MKLEHIARPLPGPVEVWRDFGIPYAVNGVIALLFAASGPVAIILTIGNHGELNETQLSSWIFGAFFVNSLLSLVFCLLYRKPLVFFWSIPGTVLVGAALMHHSFAEVVGAFIATGVLMFALGLSGWVKSVMNVIPMPIVMAMVSGVFLQFGLDLVFSVRDGFWIAAPMCAVYLILSMFHALGRLLPALIGALVTGIIVILISGDFHPAGELDWGIVLPTFVRPEFSLQAMLELVLPLAITVIVVQNGQGIAILNASGHDVPVNAATTACGGISVLTATMGTVSTCLTGPTNALICVSGERARQYTAGVFVALLGLLFGLYSSVFTHLMLAAPTTFISALAGLAMLRVLQNSIVSAFSGSCSLGALVTFLVTLANVPIFELGAPFWGLVFGCTVSWALERDEYRSVLDRDH